MIDRIFSAVLAFLLLAGGTIAIGAALFDLDRPVARSQPAAVIELPRVEVTGRRPAAVLAAREAEPGSAPVAQ